MKNIIYLVLLIPALFFVACDKGDNVDLDDLEVFYPSNFPQANYDFSHNPVTKEGFILGRKLFYDPILSRDSTISCADCHISFSAFSHPDHITSHGIDGLFGKRNAPAIQNLIWQKAYFWDGGVPEMDFISINPIENPLEMDEVPANVVKKLKRHKDYPALFKAAFPDRDTIDGIQMLQAFSQFMGMLVSANSRYDKYVRGEGGSLSQEELDGLSIFQQKCSACHATDLFTDNTYRNNGLLSEFTLDKGRFEISTLPEDIGKFKVPSLRNVALTSPYMHHGKIKTLELVMDHYNSGVKDSPTLDPLLRRPDGALGIPLTELEKTKLIAFLKTLSDETFIKDERFQKL